MIVGLSWVQFRELDAHFAKKSTKAVDINLTTIKHNLRNWILLKKCTLFECQGSTKVLIWDTILSYFKTLSIGPTPGIEPATFRSAVKRSTDWANPAAVGKHPTRFGFYYMRTRRNLTPVINVCEATPIGLVQFCSGPLWTRRITREVSSVKFEVWSLLIHKYIAVRKLNCLFTLQKLHYRSKH